MIRILAHQISWIWVRITAPYALICKLAEVPCNRRSKRRVKHKWLSKEYVPKYQATIAKGLRFSTRQASTTSSPLLFNAPMLRPRSHQHIIQPHFQRLLDFRRRCRDKRERCRLSKLIRSGLRRAMRRRRNAQLNEVLLEFRDLNRLESIRHDPLNNMNRSHEHDPQPDGFAEYLARIFAMDEADLPRRNPSQHILNILLSQSRNYRLHCVDFANTHLQTHQVWSWKCGSMRQNSCWSIGWSCITTCFELDIWTRLGSIHHSQCCPKKVTDPGRQIGDRLLHCRCCIKFFSKMIHARLQHLLDPQQPFDQTGFRQRTGVEHALCVFDNVNARSLEHNCEIWIASIDLR